MLSSSAAARRGWPARCGFRNSIDAHNAEHPEAQLSKENIYVLEKAREIGQHCLSGALLDPRSMNELLPEWRKEAPIEAEVSSDSLYYLTKKGAFKAPLTPPPMQDHGNYVISINRFAKWLGAKVEETGITIFSGFAGSELLFDGERVAGVRTDDKGVDRINQPKANFEPGYDLKAKVTILAEGTRGSLTKQLTGNAGPRCSDRNPMTYGVGVKELWELPAGRIQPGEVIYTMGYPLTTKEYGGAWIYGGKDNTVSLGFVTGLDYPDPRTDPQHVLQSFKQHPFAAKLLEGGKMVRYGAKTMPYGGWWSMPPLGGDGWMIVGDSAGFLNSQRLKGIHLAIKSGMLAAETAFEALISGDSSARQLEDFQQKVEASWIKAGALSGAQLPPGLRARLPERNAEHRPADGDRRPRPAQPLSRTRRARTHDAALGRHGAARRTRATARLGQGRRQVDLRQAHGPVSLRDAARRGSARAPDHSGHRYVQQSLHPGVRQSLPVLLSGQRL